MSRATPKFKDKAVQAPQVKEGEDPPAAKSGLCRFLGALLMKVRTGRSVTGEVRANTQTTQVRAVNNCPVVNWANQSIGTLKHCSLSITILIRIRICLMAIKIAPWKNPEWDLQVL
jgi:hypothetical protein